jgi:hypothetical protein
LEDIEGKRRKKGKGEKLDWTQMRGQMRDDRFRGTSICSLRMLFARLKMDFRETCLFRFWFLVFHYSLQAGELLQPSNEMLLS